MSEPTLLQLQCFAALVEEGSFAAAAARLHRTHPTVHTAVKTLEDQLGLVLLDRAGYRVSLTPQGAAFHARTQVFLKQFAVLQDAAIQLASGEEPELRIVIGDLCPLPATLSTLRQFFREHSGTRLTLMVEAIGGPWERLRRGQCDLIFHIQDRPSPEFETIALFDVALVPVAAPGFLADDTRPPHSPDTLRSYMQCVIRDSSSTPEAHNYHVIEGAPSCSVPDQMSKRELIAQGLAWGHMPLHLVEDDLACGRLLSLAGPQLPGATLPHFAMRRRHAAHGPVAQRLWTALKDSVGG